MHSFLGLPTCVALTMQKSEGSKSTAAQNFITFSTKILLEVPSSRPNRHSTLYVRQITSPSAEKRSTTGIENIGNPTRSISADFENRLRSGGESGKSVKLRDMLDLTDSIAGSPDNQGQINHVTRYVAEKPVGTRIM